MASSPITSWQIDGKTVETVADFIFLSSTITADGDCSHEIKRHLLLGRKVMTSLDSILKSGDITLPTYVHLVKAMVFFQESCMDMRVGLWRKLSAKELMLLNCGVGEDSWESLDCKEIQPVHSEGDQPWDFFGRNDAKSETPVLWPPHVKSWLIGKDWCWEGLGARGEGDDRGWDGWMASPTRWTWVWVNSKSWWWTGKPGVLWFMGSQRVGHDWAI